MSNNNHNMRGRKASWRVSNSDDGIKSNIPKQQAGASYWDNQPHNKGNSWDVKLTQSWDASPPKSINQYGSNQSQGYYEPIADAIPAGYYNSKVRHPPPCG